MGYAYAVGMIEALKNFGIKFGRFYIIAPENACSGGTDWSIFKEVWQYGSNLGESNADPIWEQDGVAPQIGCNGLIPEYMKRGRVFTPKNWSPKGFVESHSIGNFGWIFQKSINDAGYVKPRN